MMEERILAELEEIKDLLKTIAARSSEPRSIASLGWTREQAAEIRDSLASFEEDWNAPGMELYDDV